MKNMVKEFICEISLSADGCLVSSLVAELNDILKMRDEGYEDNFYFSIQQEESYNGLCYYLKVYAMREESDEEYKIRQDTEKTKRFKLWQKLREEFGQ